MKNVFITLFLGISLQMFGQNDSLNAPDSITEKTPSFFCSDMPHYKECTGTNIQKMSCTKALIDAHLRANFVMPEVKLPKGLKATTFIRFTVGTDGAVTNVVVLKSCGFDKLDQAGVEVVSSIPPMLPGKQDEKLVEVYFTVPIKVIL